MNIYERYCLPHLIHLACSSASIQQLRRKVVPWVRGRVLEVGFGSGLNIPFYDRSQVEFIWALEPSEGMRRKSASRIARSNLEVRWLDLPGEEIPLEDHSVDTVLLTYTLCTIADWRQALMQMRRVLKPGGQLIFSEHGLAPDLSIVKWQNRINPYWGALAGGCNLNRAIPQLIEVGGFKIENLEHSYLPAAPRFAGYNYSGSAVSR